MVTGEREQRRHHGAQVIRFVVGLVALFSLSSVIFVSVLVSGPQLVLGWEPLVVTGDSMAPRIHRGDVVVIEPFDHQRLAPGTVVVFQNPARGEDVTHRIVALNDDGTYVTRGDANEARDSTPLTPDRIQGTGRLLVPRAGMAAVWLGSRSWGPLTAFGGFLLWSACAMRFAMYDRFNPWRDPSARPAGPRFGGSWAMPVVLVVVMTATALSTSASNTSDASFTTTVENVASYFKAARWSR